MNEMSLNIRKVLKLSLLFLLTLLVMFLGIGCGGAKELDNDVSYYNRFILPTNLEESSPKISNSTVFNLKKGYTTLLSINNTKVEDEYVVGYVKKDLYDFINVLKEDKPNMYIKEVKYPYFSYEDAIMGEYISYIYNYYPDEIKSNAKVLVDYYINNDLIKVNIDNESIKWIKYKNINDIEEIIDKDYHIDVIFSVYTSTIKKDLITDEELNLKDTYLYPVMYKYVGEKLEKVTPNEKDTIWNQLMTDLSGDYIKSVFIEDNKESYTHKASLLAMPTSMYEGPLKIININNKNYVDINGLDESIVFGDYTLYSYDIEEKVNSNYYYEYDNFLTLVSNIIDNDYKPYYWSTTRWPNTEFFKEYALSFISKPAGVIIQKSENKYDNIVLDQIKKVQCDDLINELYNQGYKFSLDGVYKNNDNLIRENSDILKFEAKKITSNQEYEVSVTFYKNFDNLSIVFKKV